MPGPAGSRTSTGHPVPPRTCSRIAPAFSRAASGTHAGETPSGSVDHGKGAAGKPPCSRCITPARSMGLATEPGSAARRHGQPLGSSAHGGMREANTLSDRSSWASTRGDQDGAARSSQCRHERRCPQWCQDRLAASFRDQDRRRSGGLYRYYETQPRSEWSCRGPFLGYASSLQHMYWHSRSKRVLYEEFLQVRPGACHYRQSVD